MIVHVGDLALFSERVDNPYKMDFESSLKEIRLNDRKAAFKVLRDTGAFPESVVDA